MNGITRAPIKYAERNLFIFYDFIRFSVDCVRELETAKKCKINFVAVNNNVWPSDANKFEKCKNLTCGFSRFS